MHKKEVYLSISFFLNISEDRNLGSSIVTLVRSRDTKEEAQKDILSTDFLIIKKESELLSSYSFSVYRDDELTETFDIDSFIDGEAVVYSSPLRDGMWLLPEQDQINIVERIKNLIYGEVLECEALSICDINRLHVLMDQYCHKEDLKGRRFFSPMQGSVFIEKMSID